MFWEVSPNVSLPRQQAASIFLLHGKKFLQIYWKIFPHSAFADGTFEEKYFFLWTFFLQTNFFPLSQNIVSYLIYLMQGNCNLREQCIHRHVRQQWRNKMYDVRWCLCLVRCGDPVYWWIQHGKSSKHCHFRRLRVRDKFCYCRFSKRKYSNTLCFRCRFRRLY